MVRGALTFACVAFGVCSVALGEVRLETKFREGSTQSVDTRTKMEQVLTIAGTDVDTSADNHVTATVTVGKRDAEGQVRVEEKVDSFQATLSVMGQNLMFDSANPDAEGSSPLEFLRDVFKAVSKRKVTKVFDKFDRPVAVETDQTIVDSLPAQARDLVRSEFDAEHIRQSAAEELDQITSDPVKPGDTWKRTRTTNFGAGQLMTFETEYTYQGTEEKGGKTLDKIIGKTVSIKFAVENSTLPLTIESSDLKADESETVILFDRELGQAVASETKLHITGDLAFKVNNMDLPAKLDLKIHTTMQVKP